MNQLMTQEQFDGLIAYLDSSQGCNFHEKVPGDANSITWRCDGTLQMTRQWLADNGIAIEANIVQIEQFGGHCDCEVLFNVTDRWK